MLFTTRINLLKNLFYVTTYIGTYYLMSKMLETYVDIKQKHTALEELSKYNG